MNRRELIGKSVNMLTTPAVVIEEDALDKNLKLLDGFFEDKRCKLRPHFKSHKCVTLAKKQLAYPNTVGITCAKLSEAEQLVKGGVSDVLIANQVIGAEKVKRIAAMNKDAVVRLAVDSEIGINQLNEAAVEAGVKIGVLVEVDIGMNRGGVLPGQPVMDLVKLISEREGLSFDGLQSYEGHIVTLENYKERKRQVKAAMAPLLETRRKLEESGYKIFISSGGTGTYDITGAIDEIDELQCGSYALMDTAYNKIRPEFEYARYILTTVISKRGSTISCDVGLKGMGAEYGIPEIVGYPQAKNLYVAEEHTVFDNMGNVEIGAKLKIIPPHGCTTSNLHKHYWIAKDDLISGLWPIEGRGCIE
jgi:D-serine deaminase-like pyridoxal phosphate-dependent protein